MTQIINLANQVVKGANFTKLVKPGRNAAASFLIVSTREFALYGSYSYKAVYAVDNHGSTYRLV